MKKLLFGFQIVKSRVPQVCLSNFSLSSTFLKKFDHRCKEYGVEASQSEGHVENGGRPEDLEDLAGHHREDEPAGRSGDEHEGGVVRLQVRQHSGQP